MSDATKNGGGRSWPGAMIALAVVAVYANGLWGPFVFDDKSSIPENASIRQLWPLAGPLSPPQNTTVAGRPVLNFSLALNYAVGGLDVRGYHAANVIIHVLAALALFGIVRRTLVIVGRREEA